MKIAILGAGMTGLLAAKALKDKKVKFTIYDKDPTKLNDKGLHYLHDNCGLPLKPQTVYNYIIGCEKGKPPYQQYSQKLGTPLNNSLVSLPKSNIIYNFQEAHQILLDMMKNNIVELCFKPAMMGYFLEHFDYIISTIPLPIIYPQAKCEYVEVQVTKERPNNLPKLFGTNQVIYNVDLDINWYRYSKVFGVEWTEVKRNGEFTIKKVINTDFTPPDERVVLLGRWGSWNRKFLAHHAYYKILRRLNKHGF